MIIIMNLAKTQSEGDGSVVKSTFCSLRGPKFSSQHHVVLTNFSGTRHIAHRHT